MIYLFMELYAREIDILEFSDIHNVSVDSSCFDRAITGYISNIKGNINGII